MAKYWFPLSLTPSQPVQRAPPAVDMDEETQLQLALSLSKEEHQQVGFLWFMRVDTQQGHIRVILGI